MTITTVHLSDDIVLVEVTGRLDQDQNTQLEDSLNEVLGEGHRILIVDLTEVSYINSGGLRCLVSAWRRARKHEGDVLLCGLGERLGEIFGMVGFDKVFEVYSNRVEAQKAAEESLSS